jgi:hypothetical protein
VYHNNRPEESDPDGEAKVITKRKIMIIAGAIVALLLIGLCAFFLFRGISKLGAAEKELARKKITHEGFYKTNPFPSKQNVEQEKNNVAALEEGIGKLADSLKAGEVKAVPTRPSEFISLLGSKRKELGVAADQSGTALPVNFAYGFEQYCTPDGPRPSPTESPVLSQQLTVIEHVCGIMFQGKAKEIIKITRDELSNPGSGGGRNRLGGAAPSTQNEAGKTEDKALFTKLHFVFEFKAKENSILDILNHIARSNIFMVVTSLKIDKEFPDILDMRPAEAPAGERVGHSGEDDDVPVAVTPAATNALAVSDRSLPRNKRLMSGPKMEKPMKVKMFLEVYKFAEE